MMGCGIVDVFVFVSDDINEVSVQVVNLVVGHRS